MKKLILFSVLIIGVCKAQDVEYANINQSLVYLNPSYAGSEKCLRNQTNYRNQWPGLSGTNVTYQTCFDGFVKSINAGFALRIMSDDGARGTIRRTGIFLSYAQYIKVRSDITVIPSVQGSYSQSVLDKGRLNFGEMIDARYGITWNNNDIPRSIVKYSDLAAGILIKYDRNFEIGASFSNLLEPNIAHSGNYKLPVRSTFHILNRLPTGKYSYTDVSFIATYQYRYYNVRGNVIFKIKHGLTYGFGYGESNSYYILPGANNVFQKNIKGFLGYSTARVRLLYAYDQNVNRSSENRAPSHEVSLSVLFRKKTDRERYRN